MELHFLTMKQQKINPLGIELNKLMYVFPSYYHPDSLIFDNFFLTTILRIKKIFNPGNYTKYASYCADLLTDNMLLHL